MIARIFKIIVSAFVYYVDDLFHQVKKVLHLHQAGACVVLYYHGVSEGQRPSFARQMDMLLRHALPVPPGAVSRLEPGRHYAAVTFDDGFENIFSQALPELRLRGIPSLIFVPPAYLGAEPAWITRKDQYEAFRIIPEEGLRNLDPIVEIGSHTLTHANLTSMRREEVLQELIESKAVLEGILSRPVSCFSYPYGSCNSGTHAMALQAGYTRLFSSRPELKKKFIGEGSIGRVSVQPTDWPIEFFLKLMGCYRWIPLASKMKSGLRRCLNFPLYMQQTLPRPIKKA